MRRSTERLMVMAEAGGPLGALRLDPARFQAAMFQHLTSLPPPSPHAGRHEQHPWEILMDRCLPELADARWTADAERALAAALRDPRLRADDRVPLGLARDGLWTDTATDPVASPLFMAVFRAQLVETMRLSTALDRRLSQLGGAVASNRLSFDDLREGNAHFDEVAAQLGRLPGLRGALERQLDDAIDGALDWVSGENPPALFTLDQVLACAAALAEVPRDLPDEERHARHKAALAPIVAELREWCREQARTGPDAEAWLRLAIAVESDTVRVFGATMRNQRSWYRERFKGETALRGEEAGLTQEWMRQYEARLRAHGLTAAAERVAGAKRVLARG